MNQAVIFIARVGLACLARIIAFVLAKCLLPVLSASAVTGARDRGLGHVRVHSLGAQWSGGLKDGRNPSLCLRDVLVTAEGSSVRVERYGRGAS